MIEETIWLGDTPVATIRPKTGGVDIYYVHTDHLNTPRKVTRPSDNKLRWRWDPTPFGTSAPNENPQALGTFSYNLRFPGQYYDSESTLHYNYYRDYDPGTGRYVESDPVGLAGGINTYAYVSGSPISFFDPNGLGKESGQRGIGGDDPLIPRDINRNTPRERVNDQIKKIEDEIRRNPNMNKERLKKLRGWIKVARRGFTKAVCPPIIEDIVLGVAREACLAGDALSCQTYIELGGEIDSGA